MHVDDVAAARALVQVIDVLRDDGDAASAGLGAREGQVGRVRLVRARRSVGACRTNARR